MSIAKDIAALRARDPLFRCAYCATALAVPFSQMSDTDWEADGWELYADDEYVWQLLDGRAPAHRDHVHPKSKGGSDGLHNLVLVCDACNLAKKARSLLVFLALRAGVPRFTSVGPADATTLARSLPQRRAA